MRHENQQLLLSASDLATFLGCTHATELDRAVAEGRLKTEYRTDATLDLLRELGDRHEQAYLDYLRTEGKTVVELPKFGDPECVNNFETTSF